MTTQDDLDNLRRNALAQAESGERAYRWWIAAAAVVEGACLLAFILLADFGNRLHLLLLVTALLVYGTLALGILALGAFTQSWCRRILTAIELLDDAAGSQQERGRAP